MSDQNSQISTSNYDWKFYYKYGFLLFPSIQTVQKLVTISFYVKVKRELEKNNKIILKTGCLMI